MPSSLRIRLALALILVAGTARAQTPLGCDLSLTFFPEGFENGNVPSSWSKENQMKAGNAADDSLLPIVVSASTVPSVQVLPSYYLLEVGTVPTVCMPAQAMLIRRLLQDEEGEANSTAPALPPAVVEPVPKVPTPVVTPDVTIPVVPTPGKTNTITPTAPIPTTTVPTPNVTVPPVPVVTIPKTPVSNVTANATTPNTSIPAVSLRPGDLEVLQAAAFSVGYKTPGGLFVSVGQFSNYATAKIRPPRVNISDSMTALEGEHCFEINVTLLARSAKVRNRVSNTIQLLPERPVSLTRDVCIHRVRQPPKATVKIESCGADFVATLSDIRPLPLVDTNTDRVLYKPVVVVTGKLTATVSGSTSSSSTSRTTFKRAVVLEPKSLETEFLLTTNSLAGGQWHFVVETSLMTDYPELVSLGPEERYMDNDLTNLYNKPKFMSQVVYNNTEVNVVKEVSRLTSFSGPSQKLPAGSEAVFTWKVLGLGKTQCLVNDKIVSNVPGTRDCTSPLSFQVPQNQNTLVVRFTDFCGTMTQTTVQFGSSGWKVDESRSNTSVTTLPGGNLLGNSASSPSASRLTWAIGMLAPLVFLFLM